MRAALQHLAHLAARLGGSREENHVHFHRGPSGAPAPCFDPACTTPRLDA